MLGYPWDRVHDEAERLEHAASEELIERMAVGARRSARTIRTARRFRRAKGVVDETTLPHSRRRRSGERLRVRQVMDEDGERLRYLAELGIRPGAIVRILDRAPFDGPITLWRGRSGRRCDACHRSRAGRAGVRESLGAE